MKTAREIIAGSLDTEIWQMDAPVPTRADTEDFHRRRQQSVAQADAILAALAAEGFSIVETGRDPYLWLLETDDDTLICRSGTKSVTVRAKHATVFDIASVEPPKIVPVSALSCPTREGKTG